MGEIMFNQEKGKSLGPSNEFYCEDDSSFDDYLNDMERLAEELQNDGLIRILEAYDKNKELREKLEIGNNTLFDNRISNLILGLEEENAAFEQKLSEANKTNHGPSQP